MDAPPFDADVAPRQTPLGLIQRALDRFDSGWLFLIAGVTIIGATVLVPAMEDLEQVEHQRQRAVALQQYRQERMNRYSAFLDALEHEDPGVVRKVAAQQLRVVHPGQSPILPIAGPASSPGVFADLEPPPVRLPNFEPGRSWLSRVARDDHKRLWLIAVGAIAVLIGLMPRASATQPRS